MYIFFISFVFWANIFSFLSEYFEQDCRNWNLRVDKKFLKKIEFFEKIVGVFVFFSEMSEKFSTFDENFLAGLWKLLSTCE